MSVTPDISAERFHESDGDRFNVKLSTPDLEVNVLIRPEEIDLLSRVRGTPWESGSLRIGSAAGVPAWWCVTGEPQALSIVVGRDDQTWVVAVQFPLETIDAIVTEVQACASSTGSSYRTMM